VDSVTAPIAHTRRHRARFLTELEHFLRFPSVSSQPRHADDVARCAAWLAGHLRAIGLPQATVVPTARHPLVLARRPAPDRPRLLLYGHYDVQPADPLAEWRSPPFVPTRRGENLYGRGASDDKGQLFAHVKAIEGYLRTAGSLPVDLTCLFDGEEEIGSPSLKPFLAAHRRELACDAAVISDTRMLGPDRPAITYAMRGGLGMELEVSRPGQDLHSGNFGGAVHNPLQALCAILARLHDRSGRIAIPGFYDRVRCPSAAERAYMRRVGPTDAEIRRDALMPRPAGPTENGADLWGEPGYSLYERTTIRPDLTVNGLSGGYQGPGGKAVIPARGSAKLSFRLVPDQDPAEVEGLVRDHLARIAPPTVGLCARTQMRARPAVVDRTHPAMRAAARAYRRGFGAAPVFLRSGGTIPIVNTLQELLGVPVVLMGFALPDDALHAPNEKLHLPTFYRAIETCAWFYAELGESGHSGRGRTGIVGKERGAAGGRVASASARVPSSVGTNARG
jgi:acetylornithine deacetylase/succinyl-diaminopimelate desuccinylase-like protein